MMRPSSDLTERPSEGYPHPVFVLLVATGPAGGQLR